MASESQEQDEVPRAAPASRNWVWYFLGIAFVAVVLLGWLALFIYQQMERGRQLQLEQVRAARKLWQAHGSKDYQMVYTIQRGAGQSKDRFSVVVRGGVVQRAVLNGTVELPHEQLEFRSMDRLFMDVMKFLEDDARPGAPATLCRGYFDSKDGHLEVFVRQVIGTPERVDIKVEEFRPTDGK